ncbi:hypothetical protein N9B39_01500 [bacterium]|nr:hypothetical protein [Rubripirellula sp.]MDA7878203.1 hypothetical protein [bacterium]MDB4393750.1 hypothetical protein [Rhodopirellula sp.]MDA7915310.1 hypothetical protein [bacterium]MDB4561475.1 hypothetical protein [bacterium]MDB4624851.1 hypothetical protein [Rubripirellula sp.]
MSRPEIETQASTALGQPGLEYLTRIRRAAANVLGNSPAGREVLELCDDHAEARRRILDDRSSGLTVIASVGATGQGKSWIIRQLIGNRDARKLIKSGNNADEATEQLIWIGPAPPDNLDSTHELYVHCSVSEMQTIGTSYLLVDAPGVTDDRKSIASVAKRALSLASVMLLVVRRDQIRSETIGSLATASEGTIVIPVINAVRAEDDNLCTEVDALLARMRKAAPTSTISLPVIVDDFEIEGRGESQTGKEAAKQIAERLKSELECAWAGDRRRSARLAAIDSRFQVALHAVLSDQLPGLTAAVRRLNTEAKLLPGEIAETLVGRDGPLRAAVRSRLRLSLLTETSALYFPYRTFLSLLNLTHGAWDRVLLSLSGSLPSLVGAVWTSTKNLSANQGAERDLREGLQNRCSAAVKDRLGPLAHRFHDEVLQLRDDKASPSSSVAHGPRTQVAYLAGIDSLQENSQRIFDAEVERVAASRFTAAFSGFLGTAIFWFLMAGPIVALYRGYFDASYEALSQLSGNLSNFPRPNLAMMLTSLLLSSLPTAIFAMLVLSISQSRSRVRKAEKRIRDVHHETIERLQREGVLQLSWDEPLLADAEFLLSAGAADVES